MIIGINALGPISRDTGGRTYLSNFSRILSHWKGPDTFVFFVSTGEEDVLSSGPSLRFVHIPFSSKNSYFRLLAENILLPFSIRRERVDIMFFPGNFAPWFCPVPYGLALRSMLVYLEQTQTVDRLRVLYRKYFYPRSAQRAAVIITPSEHTKEEISRWIGISGDRIHVVPHGIDIHLFSAQHSPAKTALVLEKYRIESPYFLYVSALWEYKNQDKLILAFAKLVREKYISHSLVLVGRGMNQFGSYYDRLQRLVSDLDLRNRVRFVEFIPHNELNMVYARADVFAFPSAVESFGHPLFEALASGVPVVCSNTHGFQRMIGSSALFCDPANVDEFAGALYRASSDELFRQEMKQKGPITVRELTWDRCVEQTIQILSNVTRPGN